MAYPLPLPQQPRTTLPLQRLLDDEFAPVIRTHMRGIAFLEAYYVTIDAHGEIVVGSGVQSGFVVDDGIVTAAHGVCEWDFVTLGFNVRPVFVVSIGGMLISQEVRVLAIDTGADLAYLEMPHLPEAFPLHIFPLAAGGVQTGEHVHTVGHPGPHFYSTRDGRVSHPCRSLYSPVPHPARSPDGFNLIEVSFLTPPGFSGGPLIDTQGRVVSVNHCIVLANYNWVSLSVPVRYVTRLIEWHLQNPALIFMRSDGAPVYPMDVFAPGGYPPVWGFGGEWVGGGGEAGEGAGEGAGGAGTGEEGEAGAGTGEEGEAGEAAEDVSEFLLDFP